ncbi:hypothetical protein N7499_004454 [Penicillium canescens]|uniref:NmrA-like domain-containing protein n=1 Tax=Penicillium canescens TaxID=5083 RepID=A0AAD6I9N9_PENCN|nr:uncharacterized protein N7446_005193 [Penicillium canescens]KAJ6038393.1 hypothetical protein N7460_008164 [Penicillium canescens]KAJ6039490.1 hypothetical protein N7444_008395 [Penicillium canescens]KAJ6068156.1 hypothetical protein N7446_005193 [Penicillium canescens]KAJ6084825.1 hypothetical protein N7499_004454 [Penicillium canescens]KAJ6161611.1 hypothetical protein N7485_009841 [Penicillium canescens]
MASTTSIIFGPTGHVGSAAARIAQQCGAKVVLALRDTLRPVPGLTLEQEKAGGFERVQADLTKPETVHAAVQATGAKRAFIYLVPGTTDHMRRTIEALKASSIELVVFLSSISVHGDIRSITPADFIAYTHAQVEVNLDEVFGSDGYIAIRPAYFSTNAGWWAGMIREGEVKITYPDAKLDWISPEDIGRVAGTLLVKEMQASEGAEERNSIPLCGPKLVSQRDAVGIFGKVLGKDIKVTELDEKEGVENLLNIGVPDFVATRLVQSLKPKDRRGDDFDPFEGEAYEQAVANLQKYVGRASSLEEWAEANKEVFNL